MEENTELNINPLTGRKREFPFAPNRIGRPKGIKNKPKTALDRYKKDPAEELIRIAQLLRTCPPELQRRALELEAKIWMELLEYQKAKKKPVTEKEQKQEESKKAAAATFDLLKELENEHGINSGTTPTSDTPSLGSGEPSI